MGTGGETGLPPSLPPTLPTWGPPPNGDGNDDDMQEIQTRAKERGQAAGRQTVETGYARKRPNQKREKKRWEPRRGGHLPGYSIVAHKGRGGDMYGYTDRYTRIRAHFPTPRTRNTGNHMAKQTRSCPVLSCPVLPCLALLRSAMPWPSRRPPNGSHRRVNNTREPRRPVDWTGQLHDRWSRGG